MELSEFITSNWGQKKGKVIYLSEEDAPVFVDSDGVRYFVRLGEVVYWRPIDSRVIDATKE